MIRRTLLVLLTLSVHALTGPAFAQAPNPRPRPHPADHPQPRAHHPGHPGPAARLPPLPLRQPRRAQGRRGRLRRHRQLRRLQSLYPARQRGPGPGCTLAAGRRRHGIRQRRRPCLGNPADRFRRRGRDRLRPPGRNHRAAGRPHVDRLRAAPRGPLRRRPPRDRRGRGLDLPDPHGKRPPLRPRRLCRRAGRGGRGPAPGRVPLQVQPEPRAAPDDGRPARHAKALVGHARLHPPADRAPAGLRPLQGRELRAGPHRHLCAQTPTGGRATAPPAVASSTSTASAWSTSAIPRCCSRPSRPGRSTGGRRTSASSGPPPTTSRPWATASW